MDHNPLIVSERIKGIQIKGYGSINFTGEGRGDVYINSQDPGSTSIVIEEEQLLIVSMSTIDLLIPNGLDVKIQKCLGSSVLKNIQGHIFVAKVLGNIVIDNVNDSKIEKVGGNCRIRSVKGELEIKKIGGNVIIEDYFDLKLEKCGGSCQLNKSTGSNQIGKVGGNLKVNQLDKPISVSKIGGNFSIINGKILEAVSVGGDIKGSLEDLSQPVTLKAGGSINLTVMQSINNSTIVVNPGGEYHMQIKKEAFTGIGSTFTKEYGDGKTRLNFQAGGDILLMDEPDLIENTDNNQEISFNSQEDTVEDNLVHEKVRFATALASKKIDEAQRKLDELSQFGISKLDKFEIPSINKPPLVTEEQNFSNQKDSASDEEKLLVLNMLQQKKISIKEAENLLNILSKKG